MFRYLGIDIPCRASILLPSGCTPGHRFEMKLMNLSAVREELGLPIVEGYKALPNMAASCRELATERWGS
jgi:hypothetical protein